MLSTWRNENLEHWLVLHSFVHSIDILWAPTLCMVVGWEAQGCRHEENVKGLQGAHSLRGTQCVDHRGGNVLKVVIPGPHLAVARAKPGLEPRLQKPRLGLSLLQFFFSLPSLSALCFLFLLPRKNFLYYSSVHLVKQPSTLPLVSTSSPCSSLFLLKFFCCVLTAYVPCCHWYFPYQSAYYTGPWSVLHGHTAISRHSRCLAHRRGSIWFCWISR